MLQEILVQRVRNLQPANESERRNIFTAVGHLGKLILEVRFETIIRSHLESGVVVVFLSLSVGGVLGEKCLSYLLKIVERMCRQRVKPIRGHTFQTGWKG